MSMIKCPECGNEVSSEAKSCPNCGKPMTKKNKHLGCLIGILVVIIIGIIIGLYNRSVSENYKDTTKSSSPAYNQDQIISKTLGSIDEETYSVVSNCMQKKDFDTIKKYMALGTVVMLDPGTKISILSTSLSKTKAKILSGPYEGEILYLY